MKKIVLLFLLLLPAFCFCQQNLPFYLGEKKLKSGEKEKIEERKHIFLFGIGNVSNESFEKLNGGGKAALAFKTYSEKRIFPASYFLSFNKNATNSDTLLATTLVFPEVGAHSFLATAFWDLKRKKKREQEQNNTTNDLLSITEFFLEFATKEIKVNGDSGTAKNPAYRFNTLHFTAGFRVGYGFNKTLNGTEYNGAISIMPFVSLTNIPNEDNASLAAIIGAPVKKDMFFSAGAKVGVQINGFQIFADLRYAASKKDRLPINDLKGFNSNIGVAFNAEVFGL
jgi:hypothetical protein